MMDVSWLGENEDYKRIKEHQYDANVMFKDISFMGKPITSFGIYPAIKTQVFHYILSAHLLMKNERVHFKRSLEALYFYCHTIAVFVASTLRTWGHYLLLCYSPFNCILLFVKKLFEVFWKKTAELLPPTGNTFYSAELERQMKSYCSWCINLCKHMLIWHRSVCLLFKF